MIQKFRQLNHLHQYGIHRKLPNNCNNFCTFHTIKHRAYTKINGRPSEIYKANK